MSSHFEHGFMTGKDLEKAEKYLNIEVTPHAFQMICKTMAEGNRFYMSRFDFEYHKTVKLMRQRMYGGALP